MTLSVNQLARKFKVGDKVVRFNHDGIVKKTRIIIDIEEKFYVFGDIRAYQDENVRLSLRYVERDYRLYSEALVEFPDRFI